MLCCTDVGIVRMQSRAFCGDCNGEFTVSAIGACGAMPYPSGSWFVSLRMLLRCGKGRFCMLGLTTTTTLRRRLRFGSAEGVGCSASWGRTLWFRGVPVSGRILSVPAEGIGASTSRMNGFGYGCDSAGTSAITSASSEGRHIPPSDGEGSQGAAVVTCGGAIGLWKGLALTFTFTQGLSTPRNRFCAFHN